MKFPQVINLDTDLIMVFDGDNVINDTDQLPLGTDHSVTSIDVRVDLVSLLDGSINSTGASTITMTYVSTVDYWKILISDLKAQLGVSFSDVDKTKYVGKISEPSGTNDMRTFKLEEFSIDNESFTDVWMDLPYQVEIDGAEAWLVWYNDGYIGVSGQEKFKAPAYEDGTGTTYATDPSRVTHRGAIVKI